MFLFAGQEASSASYTNSFLARWLPHLSATELRQLTLVGRKMVHVVAYGFLTLIVYYAGRKTKKLSRRALPLAVGFAFVIALIDEGYQNQLSYRTGSLKDVLFDGLGMAVTALGLWLGTRIRRKRKEVAEDVEDKR